MTNLQRHHQYGLRERPYPPGSRGQRTSRLVKPTRRLLAVDVATDTIYVITVSGSGPNTVSVFNGAVQRD